MRPVRIRKLRHRLLHRLPRLIRTVRSEIGVGQIFPGTRRIRAVSNGDFGGFDGFGKISFHLITHGEIIRRGLVVWISPPVEFQRLHFFVFLAGDDLVIVLIDVKLLALAYPISQLVCLAGRLDRLLVFTRIRVDDSHFRVTQAKFGSSSTARL